MARPGANPLDPGALVELVTAAVLEALSGSGGGASVPAGATGHRILWLLGIPCGHLAGLQQEMAVLARLGHTQQVAAVPDVELHLRGMGELTVTPVDPVSHPGSVSGLLAGLPAADLVLVGALGFGQAQDLTALRDGDPFVQAVLGALVARRPVFLVVGDALGGLHASQPGPQGERIRRSLQTLGVREVGVTGLARPLGALEAGQSSRTRALGGLLGERDVDEASAQGLRALAVPAGTVITPLARDRARELGLTLKRL